MEAHGSWRWLLGIMDTWIHAARLHCCASPVPPPLTSLPAVLLPSPLSVSIALPGKSHGGQRGMGLLGTSCPRRC